MSATMCVYKVCGERNAKCLYLKEEKKQRAQHGRNANKRLFFFAVQHRKNTVNKTEVELS